MFVIFNAWRHTAYQAELKEGAAEKCQAHNCEEVLGTYINILDHLVDAFFIRRPVTDLFCQVKQWHVAHTRAVQLLFGLDEEGPRVV